MDQQKTPYLNLIFFAIAGLLLRWYFILKPGYQFDLGQFLKWESFIREHGFWSLYSKANVTIVDNYPPIIPLLSALWFKIMSFGVDHRTIFKIMPTIFEIVLIIVSTQFILRSKAKFKYFLAGFLLVSPAIGFVTSAWGQAESIFCLLTLLAFLILEKNSLLAVACMFAAVMTKPQALPAVLIFFLFAFLSKGLKKAAICALEFIVLAAATYFLFLFKGHINIFDLFAGSVGLYKNLSLNAFNLWWLIYKNQSWSILDTASSGISYKTVGLILFAIFELPAIYYLSKSRKVIDALLVLAYTYLCFFVFPTEIHERYLYPAVVFLGISAITDKKLLYPFLILNLTLLANNFAVLQSVYPQFNFLKGNLLSGDWTVFVAGANVLVCLYMALFLISKGYEKS